MLYDIKKDGKGNCLLALRAYTEEEYIFFEKYNSSFLYFSPKIKLEELKSEVIDKIFSSYDEIILYNSKYKPSDESLLVIKVINYKEKTRKIYKKGNLFSVDEFYKKLISNR